MATRLIFIVALLCASLVDVHSQGVRDSRGKDFWLAIPPNDHNGGSSAAIVSLMINCDGVTDVRIDARARNGTLDSRSVRVPGAVVWEFRYNATPYELVGVTSPNGATNDCERVMPMSIHITTSEDVSVYAVMRDVNTSDAWLVLPTDALGTSYRVSTYASTAVADTTRLFGTVIRTSFSEAYPSQFVLVATEDGTDITIDLSENLSAVASGSRRTVTLNQGQSYLLQARVTETRQNDDLTGSRVVSTKPICLISSHLRAQVPILSEIASRDCLVEQIPSIDTWGKRIIVPPLRRSNDFFSAGTTDVKVCRILAAEDSTLVQVNGQAPFRIDAGKFRDLALGIARDIVSSKPVLATIIDRSANRGSGGVNKSGDPSLIVMPPIEQFLSSYRVVNIEPIVTGTPFYTQHQITCVLPLAGASTLLIDGAPTPALTAIAGTTHGYVHLDVSAGPHALTCDSTFGIIIYGYGPAESYGYTGGMAFERLYIPSVTLKVLNVAGRAGDVDTIVAIVDSINNVVDLRLSGAAVLSGTVNMDLTTYIPNVALIADPSTLQGAVPFTFAFDSLDVGDTVCVVPGRHALGHDTVTTSTLSNILWQTGASDTVNIKTTIVQGKVITLDVCLDPQLRLFDPSQSRAARQRLYYDILGKCVGTTLDGLPRGVYFHK